MVLSVQENKSRVIRARLLFLLILLSYVPALSQKTLIPQKYLDIVPGVTTREDVEWIYGKTDPKRSIMTYPASDFVLTVMYSDGGCEEGRDMPWALPKGAIEEVSYSPLDDRPVRLREIILQPSKFKAKQEGDVIDHWYYRNRKRNILVVYDTTEKVVTDIAVSLTSKQKEHFACSK
jgi:hypothetical protein